MSNASVSAISAVGSASVSAASLLPTIDALRSQLILYVQFANGTGPAAADFKALEYSIATGDVSDAQTELSRLRRDSESANPISYGPAGTTDLANGAANNSLIPDTTVAGTQPAGGSLLDLMA